jgi:hypothetical protein
MEIFKAAFSHCVVVWVGISSYRASLGVRVDNCAIGFRKQPHCEAKGQSDLQWENPRGFRKRACGACDYYHVREGAGQ